MIGFLDDIGTNISPRSWLQRLVLQGHRWVETIIKVFLTDNVVVMKIDRRKFLSGVSLGGAAIATGAFAGWPGGAHAGIAAHSRLPDELSADVAILGGGLGGCAAALASLRNGLSVILTEETDWLGGQITQQGVPPDEHQWIETHGGTGTYREYRRRVREFYVRNYPLTEEAKTRPNLNPGDGRVSRICHEPRVAVAVLEEMLAPYISSGKLTVLREYRVNKASVDQDRVAAVSVRHVENKHQVVLNAHYYVDATELGNQTTFIKIGATTNSATIAPFNYDNVTIEDLRNYGTAIVGDRMPFLVEGDMCLLKLDPDASNVDFVGASTGVTSKICVLKVLKIENETRPVNFFTNPWPTQPNIRKIAKVTFGLKIPK